MYIYNQTDNNINNMPVGLPFRERGEVPQRGVLTTLASQYIWLTGWQAGQLKKNRESTNDVGQVINQQTPNDG